MPNVYEGHDESITEFAISQRYAIVVSRYNDNITRKLLDGAVSTLTAKGVAEDKIDVAWVPGAWELPLVAQQFAANAKYAAVICLGCVIRGETTHDQHINTQVSHTLGNMAIEYRRPVLFGLLTCNSLDQAMQRSGGRVGNKGEECAQAALEMVALMHKLPRRAPPMNKSPG